MEKREVEVEVEGQVLVIRMAPVIRFACCLLCLVEVTIISLQALLRSNQERHNHELLSIMVYTQNALGISECVCRGKTN